MSAQFAARITPGLEVPFNQSDAHSPAPPVITLVGEEPLVIADEPEGAPAEGKVKKTSLFGEVFSRKKSGFSRKKSVPPVFEAAPLPGDHLGMPLPGDGEPQNGVIEGGTAVAPDALSGAESRKTKKSLITSVSPMVLMLGVSIPLAAAALGAGLWTKSPPQNQSANAVAETAAHTGTAALATPILAPSAALATVRPRETVEVPPRQVPSHSEQTANLDDIFALKPVPPAGSVNSGETVTKPGGQGANPEQSNGLKIVQTEAAKLGSASGAVLPGSVSSNTGVTETPATGAKQPAQVQIASVDPKATNLDRKVEEPGLAVTNAPVPEAVHAKQKMEEAENEALSRVTEIGALLKKVREEVAALKAQDHALTVSTEARLADFERRLRLNEADAAISKVKEVDMNAPDLKPALAAPSSSAPQKPVRGSTLKTAQNPAVQVSETRTTYRIKAASPNLAMLVDANNSGDDAPLISVSAGHELAGYGKVTKIEQQGASWKIVTEHGTIQ